MAMVIEIVVLLLLAVISTLTVFGVRKAAVVLLEEYERTHPVVRRQRKLKWETDPPVSLPHKPIDRVALVKHGIVRPDPRHIEHSK